MKECVFHYVMAILEGGLSGAIFYEAEKETRKKRKILLLIAGIGWFILSLTDSLQGGEALRELRKQTVEINGGDDYE